MYMHTYNIGIVQRQFFSLICYFPFSLLLTDYQTTFVFRYKELCK
jgi:hypothetical protein